MCYGQILESGLRKARKVHRCEICKHPIKPGEEYHRSKVVDEGELGTFKYHKRCRAAFEVVLPPSDDCYVGHPREHFRDHAQEHGWRATLRAIREQMRRAVSRV